MMRWVLLVIAAVFVVGCAATPAPRTPERHAANIAAAERSGYKVIRYGDDRAVFCPTAPPTGTHIGSMCLSESEWEAVIGAAQAPNSTLRVTNTPPGPGPGSGH
jgi:hypothetical protein